MFSSDQQIAIGVPSCCRSADDQMHAGQLQFDLMTTKAEMFNEMRVGCKIWLASHAQLLIELRSEGVGDAMQ